jgi:uncharacterized delta-60 repeat protein
MFRNWFASIPGLRPAVSRHDRRSVRPTGATRSLLEVEALEDRSVPAAAGSLDPTFGTGGRVTTDFQLRRPSSDEGRSVAVQPDGKVVVLGSTGQSGTGRDFAVLRYLPTGTLDPSFGSGGKVIVPFGPGADTGSGVVLQGGKILVVGSSYQGGATGYDFAVARLNSDGSLDTSFGSGGKRFIDFGSLNDRGQGMTLQGDKIVVVGTTTQAATGDDFAIARLNSDGSLDGAFGTGGLKTIDFLSSKQQDTALAVAIQGDKIVVAGSSNVPYFRESASVFSAARLNGDGSFDTSFGNGSGRIAMSPEFMPGFCKSVVILSDKILLGGAGDPTYHSIALTRLVSNGEVDTTFGSGGRTVYNYGPGLYEGEVGPIAMQGDKIVAVCSTAQGGTRGIDFGVARFNANGSLDTSFGSAGRRTISFDTGSEYAWSVAVQPDGKIVAAGYSDNAEGDFAVARLTSNGSLDPTFSSDGKDVTDIGRSADELVDGSQSVAVQPDGKIVVLGSAYTGPVTGQDFAVARYLSDGALDPTFGVNGRVTLDFGSQFDAGWGVAVAPNGKIVLVGYSAVSTGQDFAIAVLNPDGSPDAGFGPGGRRLVNVLEYDRGRGVAVWNNKIILTGSSIDTSADPYTSWDLAVLRLNFDGTPDTSFNGTGRTVLDFGGTYDAGWGVVVQPDGKIAVAGSTGSDFLVVRLNPNGSLDPTFNGTGKTTIDFGSGDTGYSIALDGTKLVVAGQTWQAGTGQDFAVTRINGDGTLDTTFGIGGRATVDFGSTDDFGLSVAVQGDKIVVAGRSQQGAATGWDFAVARLNGDGDLDTAFNGTGKATVDFGSPTDLGGGVAIQGKNIILAGQTLQPGTGGDFALARLVGNSVPIARIGGPYSVLEGGSIVLNGSGSSDPDDDPLTYEWDLDGDGEFDDATGTSTTFSAALLDGYPGATRTVWLRVTDTSGASAINSATVNILNANPIPSIDSVGDVRVEGTAIAVTGTATDPAGSADTLTFRWEVYKDGAATPFATGGNSPSFAFTPNDNGSYRIVLTVADEDGGSATAERTITVTNVAPAVTITGPTTGQQGAGLAFGSGVTDPGAADTAAGFAYSWQVSRGGAPIDLTGVATTGATFAFTPTQAGTYILTLTVTDKDGGATPVTRALVVSATPGVTLVQGVLTITGTDGDDDIKVNPGGGAPEIKVFLNGAQTTWAGVTSIVVYANAGDDRVQIAGGITLPVVAFGGAGDDRLKAGGGPSILVGGDGDDTLLGGAGRDVLIGGRGADLIGGNGADDLMIAGYTTFDANLTALNLIRAEWTSGRSFADRVANLSGTGTSGVNAAAVLRTEGDAPTVFDDDAADRLTGGDGADWFVFHGTGVFADQVVDLSEFEGLFDLDQ